MKSGRCSRSPAWTAFRPISMDKLELLDTTIRDGELSPAFNPSFDQRLQLWNQGERT